MTSTNQVHDVPLLKQPSINKSVVQKNRITQTCVYQLLCLDTVNRDFVVSFGSVAQSKIDGGIQMIQINRFNDLF